MPFLGPKIISISNGTIIRFLFFVLLIVFIYAIRDVVAIVFVSIVIASGVRPAAHLLQKYYFPKALSVIFIYLIVFLMLGSIFYLVIPPLFSEVTDFLNTGHESLRNLPEKLIPGFYNKVNGSNSFSGILQQLMDSLEKLLPEATQGFFGTVTAVFGGFVSFILIIVISFYLSVQEGGIENFLRIISPAQYEKYVLSLWDRTQNKISKWFRGQLFLGIIVAALVYVGLTIFQIKYALSLALIAGIFELIPIFGPILSSIPAIIIALLDEPWKGLAILFLYIVIQQLENHVIFPLVMRKVIGIPSIIVILALLVGSKLAGFFGLLLSVPVAVVLMEIFNDIAEKKKTIL